MFEGSVVISKIGKTSRGFYVTERMIEKLRLKKGDRVDIIVIQILREGVPIDTKITFNNENVIGSVGKNGAIIMDKKKLDSNKIDAGITLNIEMIKIS